MMGIFIAFLVLGAIIGHYQDIQGQCQTEENQLQKFFCLAYFVCFPLKEFSVKR